MATTFVGAGFGCCLHGLYEGTTLTDEAWDSGQDTPSDDAYDVHYVQLSGDLASPGSRNFFRIPYTLPKSFRSWEAEAIRWRYQVTSFQNPASYDYLTPYITVRQTFPGRSARTVSKTINVSAGYTQTTWSTLVFPGSLMGDGWKPGALLLFDVGFEYLGFPGPTVTYRWSDVDVRAGGDNG